MSLYLQKQMYIFAHCVKLCVYTYVINTDVFHLNSSCTHIQFLVVCIVLFGFHLQFLIKFLEKYLPKLMNLLSNILFLSLFSAQGAKLISNQHFISSAAHLISRFEVQPGGINKHDYCKLCYFYIHLKQLCGLPSDSNPNKLIKKIYTNLWMCDGKCSEQISEGSQMWTVF